jgi:hypothetical protein
MKFGTQMAGSFRAISARLADAAEHLRLAAQACEATEDPKDDAGHVMPHENARRAQENARAAQALVSRAGPMLGAVIGNLPEVPS